MNRDTGEGPDRPRKILTPGRAYEEQTFLVLEEEEQGLVLN